MGQIGFEKRNSVAWITLDNEAKLNAVDAGMAARMAEAYAEIEADPDIRACVIVGAGEKSFCTGGDIGGYVAGRVVGTEGSGKPPLIPKPDANAKPFIAAIQGHCIGGGFALALACDLRIATPTARFSAPGLRRGIVPAGQQAERLVKLVPFGKALQMLLLADTVDAQDALASGLVQKLVEPADLHETARQWAERIAGFDPAAVREAKRLAYGALTMGWEESFAHGARLIEGSLRSEAGREGFSAFLQDRAKPAERP